MPARGLVRFTTYNLLNLFAADTAEDRQRYQTITGVIRALDADVLAVQEILAPDAATAAERLRRLADDAGMRCEVPGSAGSAGPSGAGAGGGFWGAGAFGGVGDPRGRVWGGGGGAAAAARWCRLGG